MQLIDAFERFYTNVSLDSLEQLGTIYAEDATLIDPIMQHQGLDKIKRYFRNMLENTRKCHCAIQHVTQQNDTVFVTWKMTIAHPQLNKGQDIAVNGISQLELAANKIVFHRDYYDLGEMIYEQVPVLKHVVKMIKKRIGE
ncbi:nuclear transport factor 2 family protein [Aliiglaciecola litoralis]|uniref:Nuclear transport factor 2 family protein n=1 Tax=Aliiglaciecola litoralis TaxID=582857 RepID=A0ABN1LM33_9ALTE